MWRVIEFIFLAVIVLISITEFFYPLLTGKKLFGSFRKELPKPINDETKADLKTKINVAKEKINEIKNVQNEVSEHFDEAIKLKNESDDLIK